MGLHQIKAKRGARNHKKKIVGRGHGSGMGKTSTRGQKGQLARKSGGVRLGFEGGQTPLFRRLPKFGFSNAPFEANQVAITIHDVNALKAEKITKDDLIKAGLVPNVRTRVKLIGNAKVNRPVQITVDAVTAGAAKAIADAGGKATATAPQMAEAKPASAK